MKDGVLLCHLLEVLTGDILPVTTCSGNENVVKGFFKFIIKKIFLIVLTMLEPLKQSKHLKELIN
jgi:hypothetical protein